VSTLCSLLHTRICFYCLEIMHKGNSKFSMMVGVVVVVVVVMEVVV
jgi:hypothetical protein